MNPNISLLSIIKRINKEKRWEQLVEKLHPEDFFILKLLDTYKKTEFTSSEIAQFLKEFAEKEKEIYDKWVQHFIKVARIDTFTPKTILEAIFKRLRKQFDVSEEIDEQGNITVVYKLKEDTEKRIVDYILPLLEYILKARSITIAGTRVALPPYMELYLKKMADVPIHQWVDGFLAIRDYYHIYVHDIKQKSSLNKTVIISKEDLPIGHNILLLKRIDEGEVSKLPYPVILELVEGLPKSLVDSTPTMREEREKAKAENRPPNKRDPAVAYGIVRDLVRIGFTITKPAEVVDELLSKANNKQAVVEEIIKRVAEGFDPKWVEIALGLAVQLPVKQSTAPYITPALIIDRTNAGKSIMGRMLGEVHDKATIASLTGYASATEIQQSILHKKSEPFFIDELEEENRKYGGYLLNLLKYGEIQISGAGKRVHTITTSSVVFTANARTRGDNIEEMAKLVIDIMSKISPNVEGLSSRLAVFDFYQFHRYQGPKKDLTLLKQLTTPIAKRLGISLATFLVYSKRVQKYINEPYPDEIKDQLAKISKEIPDSELTNPLALYIRLIPENYEKLNTLSLKMAMWNFPGLAINPIVNPVEDLDGLAEGLIMVAREKRELLYNIILGSAVRFVENLNLEMVAEINYKRLKKITRSSWVYKLLYLLTIAVDYYKDGVINWERIEREPTLKGEWQKLFGDLVLSKVLFKILENRDITAIIESLGIKLFSDEVRLKDFVTIKDKVRELVSKDI